MDVKAGKEGETAGSDSSQSPKPGQAPGASDVPPTGASARDHAAAVAAAVMERTRKRDRALVFLIAIIAIGGAISAAAFALLLRELQISADLTRQGIALARSNTQMQLRAYASVQDFKCGSCGDNAGPDEVSLRASNDGQTPALNVYAQIGWNTGDARCGAVGGGFGYTYTQARYFKNLRTFGKDARDVTTFDVNREAVQQARSTNNRLCVFGSVNYATIFNDLGERETRFCYWYARGTERAPCEDRNDQN